MRGKRGKARLNRLTLLAASMLLLAGLTACSGWSDSDNAAQAAKSEMLAANQAAPAEAAAPSMSVTSADSYGAASMAAGESAEADSAAAGESGVGGGAGIGPIADADAGYGRKVIYRADLVMKVKEFQSAQEELMNLIHLGGAYVLDFSDSRNSDEIGANYVIKVPSEGFSSFLEKLGRIDSLKFEREVKGNDVTEEYVDLEARLKVKKVVEERLLSFMDKANGTDDLVRFSNELAQVQGEIEQIKGRIRFLEQNVAFSTVNLRLYQAVVAQEEEREPDGGDKTFGERLGDALGGSANALRKFGEALLVAVAAALPVLLVVAVVGGPVYYFARKRASTKREASAERRKAWNERLAGTDGEEEVKSRAAERDAPAEAPESEEDTDGPSR